MITQMQSLCAVGLVMQWRCLLKLLLGLAPPLYQKPTFQVVAILDRILLFPRAGEIELSRITLQTRLKAGNERYPITDSTTFQNALSL